MEKNPDYLTIEEAAKRLKISTQSVYGLIERGEIQVRIPADQFDAFTERKAKWLDLKAKLEHYTPSDEVVRDILNAEEKAWYNFW